MVTPQHTHWVRTVSRVHTEGHVQGLTKRVLGVHSRPECHKRTKGFEDTGCKDQGPPPSAAPCSHLGPSASFPAHPNDPLEILSHPRKALASHLSSLPKRFVSPEAEEAVVASRGGSCRFSTLLPRPALPPPPARVPTPPRPAPSRAPGLHWPPESAYLYYLVLCFSAPPPASTSERTHPEKGETLSYWPEPLPGGGALQGERAPRFHATPPGAAIPRLQPPTSRPQAPASRPRFGRLPGGPRW